MRRCTRVLILDADTQRMTYYHLRIRVASLLSRWVDRRYIFSIYTRTHGYSTTPLREEFSSRTLSQSSRGKTRAISKEREREREKKKGRKEREKKKILRRPILVAPHPRGSNWFAIRVPEDREFIGILAGPVVVIPRKN